MVRTMNFAYALTRPGFGYGHVKMVSPHRVGSDDVADTRLRFDPGVTSDYRDNDLSLSLRAEVFRRFQRSDQDSKGVIPNFLLRPLIRTNNNLIWGFAYFGETALIYRAHAKLGRERVGDLVFQGKPGDDQLTSLDRSNYTGLRVVGRSARQITVEISYSDGRAPCRKKIPLNDNNCYVGMFDVALSSRSLFLGKLEAVSLHSDYINPPVPRGVTGDLLRHAGIG